jgi:phosphopantothenoylcysteine decarboxylase/phosphopantothenate--cysteine ligase
MGRALADAAIKLGHRVTIVTGPVEVSYPRGAKIHRIVSTEEMLAVCQELFPQVDGLIGAAAPCDYRPVQVESNKISKTGQPLRLELIETPDVVATLGAQKNGQWLVGFALETEDRRLRALAKLEKKSCDLVVSNGPQAMNARENDVEIIDRRGQVLAQLSGTKEEVGGGILRIIQERLIDRRGD